MRPIARVETELRLAGAGNMVIGLGGLAGALALGIAPARAIVPFAVVALLLTGVQTAVGHRWLARTVREAGPPGDAVRIEPFPQTLRRGAVALSFPIAAVALCLALGRGLGAVMGGVLFGIGAVDSWSAAWLARREHERGERAYRELGASPFSGGRRPLYTRPVSDSTLET